MIDKIKNNLNIIIITAVAILFFATISSYISSLQDDNFIKWFSPDETANYIISKLYGQEGQIQIFEKYNLYADDIIRPRSFRSDLGWLKPVSFLGIILIYGTIVKFTTLAILPYLTPLFAAIGIIYYYLVIKKIFGSANAVISALLLASFPVYIYYSARSMFHNVLFVVLFIIAIYYFILAFTETKKIPQKFYLIPIYSILSGLSLGFCIITRISELMWLAPVLIILLFSQIKNWSLKNLPFFLAAIFFTLLPMFYWNTILYSSPLLGGYGEMNQAISKLTSSGSSIIKLTVSGKFTQLKNLAPVISNNIFYFGFHPYQSFKMVYYYIFIMFPFYIFPAIIGFCLLVFNINKWKSKHYIYLLCWIIISIILILYYGSWEFHDNPDPKQMTIGNSYTRYWLPVYLGLLPFAAMFINKLTSFKNLLLSVISKTVIIIFFSFTSFCFLWWGSDEGLAYSYRKMEMARYELTQIRTLTEDKSIIITRYHDKLFFPDRKVIVGLFDDENMIRKYYVLTKEVPVYYYNFTFPEKDLIYLNKKLPNYGLTINFIKKINQDFSLYKLERMQ